MKGAMERNDRVLARLKKRAKDLQIETYTLYLAYRDPRTPWLAKAVTLLVVAYALSPIDLIPDFIPVLGYLDDLIIVPAGIALALKMIPTEVITNAREKAKQAKGPVGGINWVGAGMIIFIWLGLAALTILLILKLFKKIA
jgi:uncharacterized membrane protein YkvA (DUF1232 family)